ALMRAHDWSATPVGPVETWSQSLKTSIRIILGSRYPMFIWWGYPMTNFYNDAYIPILGKRHPQALSQPASLVWAEIWDTLGPQAEAVLQEGQASWNEERLLIMERNGYPEETYFTFSYSPVANDDGGVGGVFCACTEDTHRVLSERRLRTLRELGTETAKAKTAQEACENAASVLANNSRDIPFALFYLLDSDTQQAQLAGTTGLEIETLACPAAIKITDATETSDRWRLNWTIATGESRVIEDLMERFGPLPGGVWSKSPSSAVVLPLTRPGQETYGVLIAGVSPLRVFDEDYQGFFDLMAGQVTTAIANARAHEEERKRSEALAEIDRAKTAFFSNVSHEFRTPLALMLGPTEDVLSDQEVPLPSQHREQIEIVQRNSLRLLKLVNTLLDFSRIEAGRIKAVYELTDLAVFTAELASGFRSAIERANLRLIVACPLLPELVYVDREMWEKIVLNLLSNAFKFTFKGEIRVSLDWLEDRVELTVKDTGTGIPAAEIPHLFERFYRVKGTQGRSYEGSGIGLSLVQELVRLHGGTVGVTSVLGKGSRFTVSIPTGSVHLPSAPHSGSVTDRIGVTRISPSTALGAAPYVEEALRWLPEEGNSEFRIQNSELITSPSPLSSARILLADDNADMRGYVKRLLSQQYEVKAVSDGLAALSAARQRVPDMVLTDVMMPGLDGFGLLRELRANPQTREIPIILLSARAGEEARVEGLEAGADDYLIKPFSARELLARVEATLKLARLRQEASRQEQTLRTEAEAAKGRLERVLAGINDQFFVLDREWRYT
ncbi:MAG: ATP-binding protein, partial [Microcystaceae cyanobacterium]